MFVSAATVLAAGDGPPVVVEDIIEAEDVISVVAVTPIVVRAASVPENEQQGQQSGPLRESQYMAATYP